MLLAVEGGGFFSSSALGYSKGLSLLLLGQRNEDEPMRVSPWSQYQLVDLESETDLQLASAKNRLSRGCASFICFGRVSAGADTPSPLKVGPAQHQETLPNPLDLDKGNNHAIATDVEDELNSTKVALKSSLKKPPKSNPVPIEHTNELQTVRDGVSGADELNEERRRVQWTDACGNELEEIREFEPSETGESDEELENGNERSCSCTIM
ncbi:uncharacterized protein LOC116189069 [Punica granatum]|uniref:Uncharacterized protein LOC116189069 n=2 Tax=Punica granatum TaxID=22663 RepID=A0A6P8BVX3_PUNGR|nr:uncharacterized protein LOC116189069 [Punica granatum]XP_031374459.1 uncharacterized protein LOC116189069 [Punica granatum]OWM63971.1 hypothetical protein CDL15_Pgr012012 [Punica granatum]PKI72022.1 hypothetical protein CRG98_007568 [Punica granatum]